MKHARPDGDQQADTENQGRDSRLPILALGVVAVRACRLVHRFAFLTGRSVL